MTSSRLLLRNIWIVLLGAVTTYVFLAGALILASFVSSTGFMFDFAYPLPLLSAVFIVEYAFVGIAAFFSTWVRTHIYTTNTYVNIFTLATTTAVGLVLYYTHIDQIVVLDATHISAFFLFVFSSAFVIAAMFLYNYVFQYFAEVKKQKLLEEDNFTEFVVGKEEE